MDTQNQELLRERQELNESNLSETGFLYQDDLWFDCPAAARLMKISESGFYALIERYKDFIPEYMKSMRGFRARNSKHISKKGLTVLMNMKDSARSGSALAPLNMMLNEENVNFKNVKKEIAERAIEATNDPILAQLKVLTDMRMQMLGMQEGLDEVRAAVGIQAPQIENHEQRIEGLETYINPMTSKMTLSQRSYLGSRVREYAFHMQAPYAEAWTMLHDFIGKRHVENYTMNDYCVAMGILRNKFKDAKLPWSASEYANQ